MYAQNAKAARESSGLSFFEHLLIPPRFHFGIENVSLWLNMCLKFVTPEDCSESYMKQICRVTIL